MRVHRLEVDAFGPFPGTIEVDLDAIGAAGLFLIHGPTGAGKSSLLDAICYALYANLPGTRSKKGLRSDHAPEGRVPRVVLEFSASGGRYRLTRSPEFSRPKKRGTGTVPVQAKVSFEERVRGQWEVVSTSHTEVGDLVLELVGMGLAQFSKVVILPQGEFAAFLRASAEDRRELLERLFDISAYADIEAWLVERRRLSGQAAEQARTAVEANLARLHDVLAQDGQDRGPLPEGGELPAAAGDLEVIADSDALPDALRVFLAEADEAVTAAMARADAATLTERACAEDLATGRRRASHRERALRAHGHLEELDEELPRHEERRARLDAALRAEILSGHVSAQTRSEREVEAAHRAATARMAELEERGITLAATTVPDQLAALRAVSETAIALDEVAAALVSAQSRSDFLEARLRHLADEAHEAEQALAEALTTRADLQVVLAETTEPLAAATAATTDLPGAVAETEEVGRLARELTRLRREEAQLIHGDDERRALHDRALSARSQHLDLRTRQLEGIAADLAQSLADGCPCPVCGSATHPQPASSTDAVLQSDLEAAEAEAAAAEAALHGAEVALAALRATIISRREALGSLDEAALAARSVAAETALTIAREGAARLSEAETRHRRATEAVEAATLRVHELRERVVSLEAVRSGLAADLGVLEEEVSSLRARHAQCPCVQARSLTSPAFGSDETGTDETGSQRTGAEDHRATRSLLDDVVAALRDWQRASERAADVADSTMAALAETGFADLAEALEAMLPVGAVADLRHAVKRHEDARAAAEAVLADPDVLAAADGSQEDLDALIAADAAARQELLRSTRAQTSAEQRRSTLASVVPSVLESIERRASLVAEAAVLRDLADTVTGLGPNNPLRMRLAAYVLAARLERVVDFANERLRELGGGRYLLEHTDEKSGAARSGLGLRVNDLWTGRPRDTNTLSGGETFMASLALALGLADAVRAEAGGREIGMLFIDEGFGCLDEESLEEVMTVLDGLREGGRSVGIVSHVADLRSRIPHQIVVTRTQDGSQVTARTGTGSAA